VLKSYFESMPKNMRIIRGDPQHCCKHVEILKNACKGVKKLGAELVVQSLVHPIN
jgi:hypothetical protein